MFTFFDSEMNVLFFWGNAPQQKVGVIYPNFFLGSAPQQIVGVKFPIFLDHRRSNKNKQKMERRVEKLGSPCSGCTNMYTKCF